LHVQLSLEKGMEKMERGLEPTFSVSSLLPLPPTTHDFLMRGDPLVLDEEWVVLSTFHGAVSLVEAPDAHGEEKK
jgi:hypothetical protein